MKTKLKLWIVALFAGALMAQNGPLANGVYAVEESNTKGKALVTLPYKGKDVALDTATFAPLKVEGKPEITRSPGGSWLTIQLTPEAAKRLADLTSSHMDRPIAVVVGGRILSTPTVRSAITDGKARVTPCEDDSCAALLRELSK